MRFVAVAAILVSAFVGGCSSTKTKLPPDRLKSLVGTQVVLVGVAESRKGGAAIRGLDFYVWLRDVNSWPENVVTKKVEVRGRLEVDHGLPVFVQNASDPISPQGIPVPEGTDLKKASKRYVLTHPTWKVLQ
jgi:hypothetical protein